MLAHIPFNFIDVIAVQRLFPPWLAPFMPRFIPVHRPCCLACPAHCVSVAVRAFGYFSCQVASLGHTFRNATLITSRQRRQRVDKSKCSRDVNTATLPPCRRLSLHNPRQRAKESALHGSRRPGCQAGWLPGWLAASSPNCLTG